MLFYTLKGKREGNTGEIAGGFWQYGQVPLLLACLTQNALVILENTHS